jgi:rod shape-determining protein MreD
MPLASPPSPALPGVDNALSRLLPTATTLFAALLSIEPVRLPSYSALTPALILMVAYHWTIYRPDLLPAAALFAIGLVCDLLAGAAPGVSSLLLLLARAVVLRYRRYSLNRPFPFFWVGFAMLTVIVMLVSWMLHCLLQGGLLGIRGTVFRAIFTISLFPLASFVLGRMQRALMGAG